MQYLLQSTTILLEYLVIIRLALHHPRKMWLSTSPRFGFIQLHAYQCITKTVDDGLCKDGKTRLLMRRLGFGSGERSHRDEAGRFSEDGRGFIRDAHVIDPIPARTMNPYPHSHASLLHIRHVLFVTTFHRLAVPTLRVMRVVLTSDGD
jgi:hypothetical protein